MILQGQFSADIPLLDPSQARTRASAVQVHATPQKRQRQQTALPQVMVSPPSETPMRTSQQRIVSSSHLLARSEDSIPMSYSNAVVSTPLAQTSALATPCHRKRSVPELPTETPLPQQSIKRLCLTAMTSEQPIGVEKQTREPPGAGFDSMNDLTTPLVKAHEPSRTLSSNRQLKTTTNSDELAAEDIYSRLGWDDSGDELS